MSKLTFIVLKYFFVFLTGIGQSKDKVTSELVGRMADEMNYIYLF